MHTQSGRGQSRRRFMIISGVLAVLLAATALIINATRVEAEPTKPSGSDRVLAAGNLPREVDLEFHQPRDWQSTKTSASVGKFPITDCLYDRKVESLRPQNIFRRNYSFAPGGSGNRAGALIFDFSDTARAKAAYKTLSAWVSGCPELLKELGYTRTGVSPFEPVEVQNGVAHYTVVSHSILDDPQADEGVFEEFGLVRTGNRVAFVVMQTVGQDYNWSSVPNGELETYPMMRSLPKVAINLARDLTPERHLTDRNLLLKRDIPTQPGETIKVSVPGKGRVIDAASVCQSVGLGELRAQQIRNRNFRYTTSSQPSAYTIALQFPDAEAAAEAYGTYTDRIDVCPKQLREDGYWVADRPITWEPVEIAGGAAKFAELIYKFPGETDQDEGWFESVGIAQVGDRMMITIYLVYGMDFNVAYDPDGDPETGLPPHPQYALLKAAAKRLA